MWAEKMRGEEEKTVGKWQKVARKSLAICVALYYFMYLNWSADKTLLLVLFSSYSDLLLASVGR